MPVAVVAIGGNSLIRDERHPTLAGEIEALRETSTHLAAMLARGWDIVLTHGNGPQVGFNLLRSELASHVAPPLTLDVLGAQTQGSIGYLLQQILGNEMRARGIRKRIVTVVTQVVVDRDDPAFHRPTKPIGRFYDREEAERLAATRGWRMVEDAGRGWRRVVPSPMPLEIVERLTIKGLVYQSIVVIAAGGGGIPVVRRPDGSLEGIEAVIDKDLASSLLAQSIGADLLLISTAVPQVALHYGTPQERPIGTMTVAEAKQYLSQGHFPPGSMGPKVLAAVRFVEATGGEALITSPEGIEEALAGKTGTRITADAAVRHATGG
ncbi:MAG: carbamate kinase [Armatimonadota bacterium]|nr:carbamate kinase [Armatimonadota bacterium]MDR7452552.1 carbamate kinase [Armatimonadota bacterium]MDR7466882.1 carbamate kinase [Armatimonadota bacterium]MDR7492645.1 carbamate kinase [Armatimonadota bacterium]MDR7499993.1 carbamate kinase [Armatimonadota bacterium]